MANKKPLKTESGKLKQFGSTDVIPIQNLATGTPTGTKFIRDDGVLAEPSASAASLTIDQTPDNGTFGLLAGSVNGSNTLFTVSEGSYTSGGLVVFLNGVLQLQGASDDWQETTPASGTFSFNTAPLTGDIITVIYGGAGGGGGTPGGSDTQVQRNNAGSFGGISGVTSDGSVLTALSLAYSTKTANYTLTATDVTVRMNSSSARTLTLPTAVGITGKIYVLKNIGTGVCTVATTSSQTIDGFLTIDLYGNIPSASAPASSLNQILVVQSDGANWQILAYTFSWPQAFDPDILYVYRNGHWVAAITFSTSAPASPYNNQLWYDIT